MRRWTRLVVCIVWGWLGAVLPACAQGGASVPGYPVSGRVVCADTQRPARFAEVTLLAATASTGEFDRSRRAVGRTDLDGRFTINNVVPGEYYATAAMTGYVNEAGAVQAAIGTGGDALNAVAAVPRVQVTAGGGSVQLSLQRGGVLGGLVQWDDGSPGVGISMAAVPVPAGTGAISTPQAGNGGPRGSAQLSVTSDDRGRFRLSGLPPGAYLLRANLQSPMMGSSPGAGRFPRLMTLRVFAPGKQRQSEATIYTLTAGEERTDIAVTLNLNGLHTVTGQVSSPGAAVRGGSVQLTDQTDNSLNRRGDVDGNGEFTVAYVPPGTYSLRVTATSQAASQERGNEPVVRFQPFQESVTVTDSDLTGLAVTVTPATGTP